MQLEWFGHSSFRVTSESDSLVTDPYKTADVGAEFPDISCKNVLISHDHFDHNYIAAVKGAQNVISTCGKHTVGDMVIEGIPSYHDDKLGALRGNNVIYRITAGDVTVCHMGDIGEPVTDDIVKRIGKVNVLMIPVGGIYTVDAVGAKAYVDKIKPDVAIPMHYFMPGYVIEFNKLDEFIELFDGKDVTFANDSSLKFTAKDFCEGAKTHVIVAKKVI